MRTSLSLLCAAALAALSCSDEGAESSPRPSSMEPSSGPSNQSTRVTIRGDGFLAVPSEQQSGGGAVIDARHRAWLDDVELEAVTWIDAHTLEAIVPVGLPAGPKRLQVENALGKRGALENAFTVNRAGTQTPAALLVALSVEGNPTTVAVGQALNLTLTVTDTGQEGANVTVVTPSVSPAGAATCEAPSPAPPRTIAGLASATFTWTCTAVTTGDLTLGASVAGTAATSGAALQVDAPGVALSVQLPAALTATIAATRNDAPALTANVGQAVTATFTVINGGSATANITTVTRATSGTATASCTQPTPGPGPIPTGGTRTFSWTCTASTAGTLVITGTASGTDAVSGGPISATPATPASVVIQTPAALTASLATVPSTVNVGQPVSVTLAVQNTGGASAVISSVAPFPASCGAVSPATPQTVVGGTTATFTWSCTPSSQGTFTLDATVTASDANTGAASNPAVAPVNVTVLRPAVLTAAVGAAPATVNVGQAVTVTFTVTNGGAATANLTAVTPVFSGVVAGCNLVNPDLSPLAAGLSREFTWTCTPTAAGTLSLSGIVEGTDEVSNLPVSATPTTPASVTVQTPSALTAALAVQGNPTTVLVDQVLLVTLTVTNTGQAGASVDVQPSATNASCGTPSPAPPEPVAGLGTLTFTWSCTPLAPGALALGASVAGIDANSGQAVGATVPAVNLTVASLASLTGTLTPSATIVAIGTPVTLTLEVQNAGATGAHISSVTPTDSPGGANGSCDPRATPASQDVAGNSAVAFTWTCTPERRNVFTYGATVVATDLNDAPLTVAVSDVTVTAN